MALPTYQAATQTTPSVIGARYGMVSRFLVRSSDPLNDVLKTDVIEQRWGRVEWSEQRYLTETEIIEELVHVPTKTVCWTSHRPTKGWYLHLRSPALPPNVRIPLTPVSSTANFPVPELPEGCFTFACRTMAFDPAAQRQNKASTSEPPSQHSYPPSPSGSPRESISSTSTLVQEDGGKTTDQDAVNAVASSSRPSSLQAPTQQHPPARPQSQITQFLIVPEPHLVESEEPTPQQAHQVSGLFSSISKKIAGAMEHRKSFRIKVPSGPPRSASDPQPSLSPTMLTLATFYDTTALRMGAPETGTIELDEGIARLLGVDKGFYVAVCLAFMEFLEDKEGYMAAANG